MGSQSLPGSRTHRGGFTLIELLVVVGIIAVLIAILIPSLSLARDLAQSSACAAHMKAAGTAVEMYATQYRGFIPGANTSGVQIRSGFNQWQRNPLQPVQNVDWVSPTLGSSLGLDPERIPRMRDIFNNKFKCPANNQFYDFEFGGSTIPNVQSLNVTSYSSNMCVQIRDGFVRDPARPQGAGSVTSAIDFSRRFNFKTDALGASASQKVWAVDGARFWDRSKGQISFNAIPFQDDGGNFAAFGPLFQASVISGHPWELDVTGPADNRRLTPTRNAERLAFRHRGKMSAVFFDGHAETLKAEDIVQVDKWLPAGSKVKNANLTNDPKDRNGYEIR